MSKLEELMRQHCPDGVEWKTLGEIFNIITDYTAAGSFKSIADNVKYLKSPDYAMLVRTTDLKSHFTKGDFIYVSQSAYDYLWRVHMDSDCIVMPNVGNCGEIYFVTPNDLPYNHCALAPNAILLRSNSQNIKYLSYYLQTDSFQQQLYKITSPVGQSKFNKTEIKRLQIPIPPLPVQEEIVRILDNFSSYTAELQAELQARRSQYDYYRNHLLAFDGRTDIQWKKISEVFEIRNGYTPSKSEALFWENGTIPWFRMEDIRANGRILKDSIQHITPKGVKGKGLFSANSIILATTATIGEHAMIIADSLANQQFTNFKICKSLENKLMTKFVFYYFFEIDKWCMRNVNVSSFPSVDVGLLKEQLFPIPPLAEQQRIVDILDRFDALCNDLTSGLPAEIEMRRRQYAHYRDRLLSF